MWIYLFKEVKSMKAQVSGRKSNKNKKKVKACKK